MSESAPSAYDAAAHTFDDHRELPTGVPEAIRPAVWASAGVTPRGRVLDLGAGTGRVGRTFVAAGDRYVGVDASLGMLGEFAAHLKRAGALSCLAQADGERLPFADGTFDVVLLIQVLSGAQGGRRLLMDARRVLRPAGALVVGRTNKPEEGVDARLKRQLAVILSDLGVEPDGPQGRRSGALSWLESSADQRACVAATSWVSPRTPRRFIERHQTGHRFSLLPAVIREKAIAELSKWGTATFGSLESVFPETYVFELQVFKFLNRQGA